MKTICQATFRIFTAICLLAGQPWPVMAADPEVPTSEVQTSASPEESTSSPVFSHTKRPTSVLMGGIMLPKNPITMDFQEADVRDVLHLLALKSGLNVIYGADVVGPVTVHLDRVPFDQAFQTILTLKTLVALPMGPKIIRV